MKRVLRVGDLVLVCSDFVPDFPESPLVGKVGVIVDTVQPLFTTPRHLVLVDGKRSIFLEQELVIASREAENEH